jgi:predicted NBD/HSP70 family sugar kinase
MNPENTVQNVNPRIIKDINVSLIQSCIYKKGPISRIDIASETNSSTATVSRVVNALLKKNIVNTIGIVESPGLGRKAELIEFNYGYGSVIGLHIHEQHIEIALCDLKGRIIQKDSIPIANDRASFLASVFGLIDGVLKNTSAGKLLTISVACPGLVDFESGRIEQSIDIPILKELSLKEGLESGYHVPVCIDNDVNIAAIGEYSFYKTKNVHNMAYIEFGPGIGAGIIINGELYRGYVSGAGELAYCLLDESDLYEHHLDNGSFSASINVGAVEGKIRSIIGIKYPDLADSPYPLLLEKVMEMYADDDFLARKLVDGVINKIAMAVCNYSCILNPQLIVLDGDFVNAWRDVLLKKVRRALAMSYPLAPEIIAARQEMSSKLVGAIEIALNNAAQILHLRGMHFDIN